MEISPPRSTQHFVCEAAFSLLVWLREFGFSWVQGEVVGQFVWVEGPFGFGGSC